MIKKMMKKINKVYRLAKSYTIYYYQKTFVGFGLSTDDEVEAFENIDFEEVE